MTFITTIRRAIRNAYRSVEDWTAIIVLLSIAILPTIEVVARALGKPGIRGNSDYLQHIVLWLTFVGGMITSRQNQHIALAIATEHMKGRALDAAKTFSAIVASAVTTIFAFASWDFMQTGFEPGTLIGIVPIKWFLIIMPVGFALIIEDNGRGFVTNHAAGLSPGAQQEKRRGGGNGLLNLQKRSQDLGGTCEVTSSPGRGTRVALSIPIKF